MLNVKELSGNLGMLSGSSDRLRILFVVQGDGGVELDGHPFGLRRGTVCFVDSGVMLSISAIAERCYVLELDRMLWEHFLLLYPLARGVSAFSRLLVLDLELDVSRKAEDRLCQLMLEVLRGVGYEQQKLLFSLFLLEVLIDKVEVAEPVDIPRQLLLEFVQLLEANFKQERSTRFYARRLAVSSRRLNELCRGWFEGRDVFEVLMDRICSEAEFMLLGSDVPVKAVAYELGFSSTHHFRVYFKRFRGVTPSEVRGSKEEK